MEGIPFLAPQRYHFALTGLTIDVQELWGREALVAYHSGMGGGC